MVVNYFFVCGRSADTCRSPHEVRAIDGRADHTVLTPCGLLHLCQFLIFKLTHYRSFSTGLLGSAGDQAPFQPGRVRNPSEPRNPVIASAFWAAAEFTASMTISAVSGTS